MNRRIIIVGPSGSGKTTVAQAVARELKLPVVSMDDFRQRRRYPIYATYAGKRIRTFEHPDLWDSNAMACKLRALILADSGFVAEGNHLLTYPAIATIPECERYYLDVPHKVSLKRRKTRHRYLPADESFALIGETETMKYIWPQKTLPGIRVIDATQSTYCIGHDIIHRNPRLVVTLNA